MASIDARAQATLLSLLYRHFQTLSLPQTKHSKWFHNCRRVIIKQATFRKARNILDFRSYRTTSLRKFPSQATVLSIVQRRR